MNDAHEHPAAQVNPGANGVHCRGSRLLSPLLSCEEGL